MQPTSLLFLPPQKGQRKLAAAAAAGAGERKNAKSVGQSRPARSRKVEDGRCTAKSWRAEEYQVAAQKAKPGRGPEERRAETLRPSPVCIYSADA